MTEMLVTAILAGVILNAADIAVTLLFTARPWNAVLLSQGLMPSAWTPPYYIIVNFIGAAVLLTTYRLLAQVEGTGAATALIASLSIWFVTRMYGGGHAVMGQMPVRLFAIMSAGLALGYVLAGQFIAYWIG
jgi:hypothetical protein